MAGGPRTDERLRLPPFDAAVRASVERDLVKARLPCRDVMELLRTHCVDRSVLDVGAVDPGAELAGRLWKHRFIARWARRAVAVDNDLAGVRAMREEGFDARLVDATGTASIGERFDTVWVGDVVEHVDDPVALLRFARRHKRSDGVVLMKTPNPHFWKYVLRGVRGTFVSNIDHVNWVSPSMALELGRRAGIRLERYWAVQSCGGGVAERAVHWLRDRLAPASELFAWSYVYDFR